MWFYGAMNSKIDIISANVTNKQKSSTVKTEHIRLITGHQ